MNTKQLRKIHRDKYTDVVEREVKKDEYENVRIRKPDYIPFKVWLRGVQPESVLMKVEKLTGKALRIRGGK